jgi:hypothetical protein
MFRLKPFLMTASLLGSLFGFACGAVSAQVAPVEPAPSALQGPEQRVALVIGNSTYQNAPQLANPDNDAESMAKFLNSAGFEVVAATDLTQNDMLKVVQDFSAKVSARGPNTVAMVYTPVTACSSPARTTSFPSTPRFRARPSSSTTPSAWST